MPRQQDENFDDPHLKDAVRRCWACDCAPDGLQKQIAKMLADSKNAALPGHRPLGRMSWVIWPMTVAASVMLGIGIFHQFQNHFAAPPALPVALETDLIHRHDSCSKLPDHQHLKVPKYDDVAIADAMHAKLNRAVLMFRPRDHDWQFRGAAVCPVGPTPAGHLVFVKGNEALSIFSLPKSLIPNATDGEEFASHVDNHCVIGFIKNDALFCAVSSGPISIDQLKTMQSRMEPTVARITAPRSSPVVLTELLQPVSQIR